MLQFPFFSKFQKRFGKEPSDAQSSDSRIISLLKIRNTFGGISLVSVTKKPYPIILEAYYWIERTN